LFVSRTRIARISRVPFDAAFRRWVNVIFEIFWLTLSWSSSPSASRSSSPGSGTSTSTSGVSASSADAPAVIATPRAAKNSRSVTDTSGRDRNLDKASAGNRFSVAVQNNSYSKQINFSYVDPYFTDDGVSVGYNVSYSDFNQANFNTARYTNSTAAGQVILGIPLTETNSLQFMLGIDRNQLTTTDGSTPQVLANYLVSTMGERARDLIGYGADTVDNDGNPLTPAANDDADPTTADPGGPPFYSPNRQWTINAWRMRAGWSKDTRNDYLLPTAGTYNSIGAEVALPGSDLEYYLLSYNFEHYTRLSPWFILKFGADLGYGDSYGSTRSKQCTLYDNQEVAIPGTGSHCGLPFFKNYYAGGPGSLRGFEQNTLGPIDDTFGFRQPLGGAVKTIGSFELFFPQLIKASGTRASVFLDYGNVFASTSDVSFKEFRVSTGLAVQWQSPLGPISISYAFPLKKEDGDKIERLQFNFGRQY